MSIVLRRHSQPKNGLRDIQWNPNILFYVVICFFNGALKADGTLGENEEPKSSQGE